MTAKMTITLQTMKFYAFHGHFDIEKLVGNHFTVDLQVTTPPPAACVTDQLADALDYQLLHRIVQEEMAIPSNLLEHVSTRIADRIEAAFPAIDQINIKVAKLNPPMGGDLESVGVHLERSKQVAQ